MSSTILGGARLRLVGRRAAPTTSQPTEQASSALQAIVRDAESQLAHAVTSYGAESSQVASLREELRSYRASLLALPSSTVVHADSSWVGAGERALGLNAATVALS